MCHARPAHPACWGRPLLSGRPGLCPGRLPHSLQRGRLRGRPGLRAATKAAERGRCRSASGTREGALPRWVRARPLPDRARGAVAWPALPSPRSGRWRQGTVSLGGSVRASPSRQNHRHGARGPRLPGGRHRTPAGWRPAGLLTCLSSLAFPRGSARPPRTPTTPSRCRRCPLASGAGLPHALASPAGARTVRAPGKSIYLRLGSLLFLHHQSGRFKLRHLVPSSPRLSSTGRRPWAAAGPGGARCGHDTFPPLGRRGPRLLPGRRAHPSAQSSALCFVTPPGDPKRRRSVRLRSCCKFGIGCPRSPHFLSLGQAAVPPGEGLGRGMGPPPPSGEASCEQCHRSMN